ncbi:Glutaredoxin domain-containing cysteine-rich protein 2 [Tauraco erythrolophus]|uniref:Glutaredoxin domain-containing cysteine-rich protein 2 n=1 Tax=Tauraco erythrolophus TaxID=121530 RepID=A0A093EXM9_TAUER|nr:Glutaredoxin domain-containing cysteine-rich protein 2 [Tauraco erythrolophus]
MDEHQKKLNQRHEGRPRKVRFKISSSYSGRVLKQVYEDGQELEPPAKEHSRRFLRHGFEPGDRFCGAREMPESSALGGCGEPVRVAKQITGWKGCSSESPGIISVCRVYLYRRDTDKILLQASPILDFGKIIIYTNNLKIIRAPIDQKELMRRIIQTEEVNDWAFIYQERKERFGGGHKKDMEKKVVCNRYVQEGDAEHGCSQCKGSGSAPCSLCHGSKFSMLANRFRESYRALRCPACNESGLQPCQLCAA